MADPSSPNPDRAAADAATHYHERLLPSLPVWLVSLAVGVAMWFVFSALHSLAGVLFALAGAGGVAAVLWWSSPVVQVRTGPDGQRWLHAGRAQIEVRYLGTGVALDVEGMRQAMGPELRADAYVCHRPWISTGLRLAVTDPEDPTPYWLVASRTPEQLATAVAARPPSGGTGQGAAVAE